MELVPVVVRDAIVAARDGNVSNQLSDVIRGMETSATI
jgi:hypothetical protein